MSVGGTALFQFQKCKILPFLLVGIVTLSAITAASFSHAQSPPVDPGDIPATCDPDYMDVLNARSYLEGKREMEAAQRLILKADSVLEYSCFNEDLIWVGTSGGRFSARGLQTGVPPPEFDGTPPPTRVLPISLSEALADVVSRSLVGFLDSFYHIYGGGSYPIIPSPAAGCNPMNVVWHTAKCESFNPNWWVRFENLDSFDIRFFPEPCAAFEPNRGTTISAALAAAYPVPSLPATNGGMDTTLGYVSYITGAGGCAASSPIETGVIAEIDGSNVNDSVCVSPGCSFDGSGGCF